MNKKLKNIFIIGHRYLGLFLAPVFMIILLSGAVLALKPILAPEIGSGVDSSISTQQLVQTIEKLDPNGEATTLNILQGGKQIVLNGKKGSPSGIFDIASSQRVGDAGMSVIVYNWFKNLHKELLIDAGDVVEIATYLMLGILIIGPFLLWPRLKKSLIDVHNLLGWFVYPLWLLLPITAILMELHVGSPNFKQLKDAQRMPLSEAVQQISDQKALAALTSIEVIKGKYQLVKLTEQNQSLSYKFDQEYRLTPTNFGRYWPKELHEGTWAGAFSGWLNFLVSIGLMVLTGTGFYSWFRRHLQGKNKQVRSNERILVGFASQTGTAATLAQKTAQMLRDAGESVVCNPLSSISPMELNQYEYCLFIVSTTGEGDLPEQAKKFVALLNQSDLSHTEFGLLALGDSRYDHFCKAGENIYKHLLQKGAKACVPISCVDGAPNAAWQQWLIEMVQIMNVAIDKIDDLVQDLPISLTLINKKRLDNPDLDYRETWQLDFQATKECQFRPGDLLLLSPSEKERPRAYSIGSSYRLGTVLSLTVGLEQFKNSAGDKQYGLCSYYLCKTLTKGSKINAFLRKHPDFNPPSNPQQKIILLASGTGIAAFPGFMAEREQQGSFGNTWLFFGNRHHLGDFFYRTSLEKWQENKVLAHLNTAFSRDPEDGEYVQHKMLAEANELYRWITEEDAIIYICGKSDTIGMGALKALKTIYQQKNHADEETADAWLVNLQSKQKIRMDLFG